MNKIYEWVKTPNITKHPKQNGTITKRPMEQNSQCNKTPNDTKRPKQNGTITKLPMIQNTQNKTVQLQNAQWNKTPNETKSPHFM